MIEFHQSPLSVFKSWLLIVVVCSCLCWSGTKPVAYPLACVVAKSLPIFGLKFALWNGSRYYAAIRCHSQSADIPSYRSYVWLAERCRGFALGSTLWWARACSAPHEVQGEICVVSLFVCTFCNFQFICFVYPVNFLSSAISAWDHLPSFNLSRRRLCSFSLMFIIKVLLQSQHVYHFPVVEPLGYERRLGQKWRFNLFF